MIVSGLLVEAADTLGVVPAWIEAHCVIPDQDHRGEPFLLGDEQFAFVVNHYRVKPRVNFGWILHPPTPQQTLKPVDAFVFRRSQLVRAQKWGKSPLVAAFTCAEGVGPVVPFGRAVGGEVYDCRDFGCGCGFVYEYAPGEPMGRPWSTPLIQITATSEDQTDNTYDALRPMIDLGPLSELIPKTGEEFIRLPGGGRIDAVTSKANTRLGQRVTFAPQDETGLWVESNGGHKLARTQRRGLAGMGGRAIETTNAWNPAENSVAQQTFESRSKDINKDFQSPPSHLDFGKKADRHQILLFNYKAAPWVSVGAVEAEAAELMETDPADAERFFGNRIVAGAGSWLEMPKVPAGAPVEVKFRTRVCGGFDGSDNDDHTGIRLATIDGHRFTPTYGDDNRKTYWRPQDWGGRVPRAEVAAAWSELGAQFEFVRVYMDPHLWESEIDALASTFGAKVFLPWPTNQLNRMHAALERYRTDLYNKDSLFTWDGDLDLEASMRNAVMRMRTVDPLTGLRRYFIGKASDPQKIDLLMSDVLAHEALNDAMAAGLTAEKEPFYVYY